MTEQDDSVGMGGEPTEASTEPDDALLSRLRLIEDQPLDQRAAAFAQIHESLQSTLEGGDASGRNG